MGILGYQIIIGSIILVFSFFGRTAYLIAMVGTILWTIGHIFMPWLMVIQFVTIGIAGLIGFLIANTMSEITAKLFPHLENLYEFLVDKRINWLKEKAINNSPDAYYKLGRIYENKYQKEKAITYYKNAEKLGHPKATESISRVEGSWCFIATVCYSKNSFIVLSFQQYRDIVLVKNIFGRLFIRGYYRFGPSLARYTHGKPKVINITKYLLEKIHEKYVIKKKA